MEYIDRFIFSVYLLIFYSFNALLNITDGFTNEIYRWINTVGNVVCINDTSLYFFSFFVIFNFFHCNPLSIYEDIFLGVYR